MQSTPRPARPARHRTARGLWRYPLAVWSVLLFGAGVLVLVFLVQPAAWERMSATWRARLSDSADNLVGVVANWRAAALRDAALVGALLPEEVPRGEAGAPSELDRLLRNRRQSALFVLDARLAPLIAHPPQAVFRPDYLAVARDAGATRAASAEFFIDQDALVLLACAREGGDNAGEGRLVCLQEDVTDQVPALLGAFPGTASQEALLGRVAGGSILQVGPARLADATFPKLIERPDPRLAMVAALSGTPAVGEYADDRGTPVLAAVRRVPDTRWGVVVKIDLAEIRAGYLRDLRQIWSLALAGAVALFGLATGFTRARHAALETDRLRAQARLGAVMDGASDAILLVRSDGRIVDANRRAALLYGRSRDELRTMPIALLQADDARPSTPEGHATGESDGPSLFETTHTTRDGRPFTAELSSRWLADERVHLYMIRDVTTRKRTEAALRSTADELAAVIDAAPVSILSVSPEGAVRSWNPASTRIFGWTAAEVLGHPLPFVPAARREESQRILARVRRGERMDGLELRRARKDGSPIDVTLWTAPLQLPDGRFTGTMAVMVDITERKRLEAQLALRVRLYQTLSQVNKLIVQGDDRTVLFDGVCRILCAVGGFPVAWIGWKGEDGRVAVVARAGPSAAYADGLDVRWDDTPRGRGPTGVAIRQRRAIVVPDLTLDPRFEPWRDRATAHGLLSMGAFPIVTGDDPVGALMVFASEQGALGPEEQELVAELAADVGFALESLAHRRERRSLEEKLRAVFEGDLIGMLLGDVHGRVFDANDAFLRIIGYSREEVERGAVRWDDITPPEHLPRDEAGVAEARARGTCTPYEKEYVRKDGTRVWVLVGFVLLEPDRERSVAFILDISRQKETEEEIRQLNLGLEQRVRERTADLEAANQELEAFSYSVSHDLRAPLRAIEGFSRIVVEDHGPTLDAEARRLLNVVRANVRKMDRLIDDLLELSRVGRREMRMTKVDMGRLAHAAWQEVEADTAGRVKLRMGELPVTAGDLALLRQVWANLLSNAAKFAALRPAPLVEVGARREDGGTVYFVRDNGVGFDPRHADRLFQVFQRLHADTEFPGTGVGLAIVARAVGRHGGRVWAEGRPGEGATFSFTLPPRSRTPDRIPD